MENPENPPKQIRKRGRPPKKIIEEIIEEHNINLEPPAESPAVAQPAKKRGRPPKAPPEVPVVKKPKGRPRKFKALLNVEIPASKYLKEGFMKKEISEMDKINMNENTQSILERAHKSGFQIRDLTKESPDFIANIPRGTFIKYITTLNQFRVGGILRQVDDQLRYFSLYNPKLKSSWSVQVKNVKYLMFKQAKLASMAPTEPFKSKNKLEDGNNE
jgi:hypothetical protein